MGKLLGPPHAVPEDVMPADIMAYDIMSPQLPTTKNQGPRMRGQEKKSRSIKKKRKFGSG